MISSPSSNKRSIDLEAATAIGNIVKGSLKKGRSFKSKKPTSKGEHKVADGGKNKVADSGKVTTQRKNNLKKADSRAMGTNPTHTRNADTGRLNKVTPAQKEGISKYYSSRQFPKSTTPAADLREFE
jgi:hypothetical protein